MSLPLSTDTTSNTGTIQTSPAVISVIADFMVGENILNVKTRGTYGLRKLLERSGIAQTEYRGQKKSSWMGDVLTPLTRDEILTIITRLVSIEENGSELAATHALKALNQALAQHGMQVARNAKGLLIFVDVSESIKQVESLEITPHGLVDPGFEQLDISEDEAHRLQIGWSEAIKCYTAEAYLAAIIMLGSLLEAVLVLALKRNRKTLLEAGIRYNDNRNQERPIDKWTFGEMISATGRLGWTSVKLTAFSHSLREYRNYVHPELRQRLGDLPKGHECLIGSAVIAGAIQDLKRVINQESLQE